MSTQMSIENEEQILAMASSGKLESLNLSSLPFHRKLWKEKQPLIAICSIITRLTSHFGLTSWSELRGYRSLDIGCGGYDLGADGAYPWLPALLGSLGVIATGIDLGRQPANSSSYYHHIQADITQPDFLPTLQRFQNTHIITCLNVFGRSVSPALKDTCHKRGISHLKLQDDLERSLHQIVSPRGIVYIGEV